MHKSIFACIACLCAAAFWHPRDRDLVSQTMSIRPSSPCLGDTASQLWAWDARRAGGRLVCGAASAASASRSTHRQQPAANDGYAGIGGERRRVRQADPERLTRNFCAIPATPRDLCAVRAVCLAVCLSGCVYAGNDSISELPSATSTSTSTRPSRRDPAAPEDPGGILWATAWIDDSRH